MALVVGNKYYKVLDDESIEIIRLQKIDNDRLLFKNGKGKLIEKAKEEIENNYILLRPDAYITFTIVQLEGGFKDVLVSMHRIKDIKEDTNALPYAVCRQSIYDIFANQTVTDENTVYVGVSISKDTCPPDIPFEMTLACNGVENMEMVSAYMDDTLNKLLTFISIYKYDKVLKEIAINSNKISNSMKGYSLTLRQLLTDNYFMFDFMRGFNIYPVNFKIILKDKDQLIQEQQLYFENLLKHTMHFVTVVKYSKDIDMSKIKKKYILVSDKNHNLYIIAYEEGTHVNRSYDILDDKRDYIAMKKYTKNN